MPLSSRAISSIQTAGAAVHSAEMEMQQCAQAYEEQVKLTMRENPFDANGKNLFESWKAAALLAQGLTEMEWKFQRLYRAAQELASDPSSAIALLTSLNEPKVRKSPTGRATNDRAAASRRTRATPVKSSSTSPKSRESGELRGNAVRVLDRLQKLLNPDEFIKINRAAVASEVGLPKGSIGASIEKLLSTGHLIEGGSGYFKLGTVKK